MRGYITREANELPGKAVEPLRYNAWLRAKAFNKRIQLLKREINRAEQRGRWQEAAEYRQTLANLVVEVTTPAPAELIERAV